MIEFSRPDPYPGVYVQGVREYAENGTVRTAAVAIGPEFGTVGPELVRDAAKEAVKVADLLVVCGFAFDPLVGEEASSLGRLTIVRARMNPDLAMGDELLKKTGTGNLFMVFGEPDIDVREVGRASSRSRSAASTSTTRPPARSAHPRPTTSPPGSSTPTTTATPSSVRHAYLIGADNPYEKLRRALRADISEDAWASVNSTVSRSFARPRSGKIAIKVIDHYGDEVLKVVFAATPDMPH